MILFKVYLGTIVASLISELLMYPKKLKYYPSYNHKDGILNAMIIAMIPGMNIMNTIMGISVTFSKRSFDKWLSVVNEVMNNK